MKPDELAKAIIQGDTRTLEGIKGIGKKTAERMVLELRDKLAKHPLESNISPLKNNTLHQDALNALTALGINPVRLPDKQFKRPYSRTQIVSY